MSTEFVATNERERLANLMEYRILDTSPERELDEIAEIASAICDTPISLISLIDDKRQWFKAKRGLDVSETPREHSFCQFALQHPADVLVVDDPLNDERFRDNPLVLGDPRIRFYAGAPLITPEGYALGTLCIIDNKERTISENQKKALKLLAQKAINFLETRKLLIEQSHKIELNASLLKKLSDLAPGAIYQYEVTADGCASFPFVSRGAASLHPDLSPEALQSNPALIFDVIHPDDRAAVRESMQEALLNLTTWSKEYRVGTDEQGTKWCLGSAQPEIKANGTVVWYGTVQNITERKEYTETLEQILFDLSHTMRRPVATMLGLTALIERSDLDAEALKEFIGYLKTVSKEMDGHIKKLNGAYLEIQDKMSLRSSVH